MKFINETDEVKKVRLKNKKEPCGYSWVNVRPGEEIDGISLRHGKLLGLSVVGKDDKDVHSNSVDVDPIEQKKEYRKRLLEVKGVGPKTVDDLVKVYPTLEDLKKALGDDVELPIRDDAALALKKEEF